MEFLPQEHQIAGRWSNNMLVYNFASDVMGQLSPMLSMIHVHCDSHHVTKQHCNYLCGTTASLSKDGHPPKLKGWAKTDLPWKPTGKIPTTPKKSALGYKLQCCFSMFESDSGGGNQTSVRTISCSSLIDFIDRMMTAIFNFLDYNDFVNY